jgi:hypothetical protein
MKRLVFIIAIIPFITSCLKYSEPKSLSLSGEYVIDKITYQETDGEPSPQDSTYLTGSVYNDNTEIPSLSEIPFFAVVCILRIEFFSDSEIINLCPILII